MCFILSCNLRVRVDNNKEFSIYLSISSGIHTNITLVMFDILETALPIGDVVVQDYQEFIMELSMC